LPHTRTNCVYARTATPTSYPHRTPSHHPPCLTHLHFHTTLPTTDTARAVLPCTPPYEHHGWWTTWGLTLKEPPYYRNHSSLPWFLTSVCRLVYSMARLFIGFTKTCAILCATAFVVGCISQQVLFHSMATTTLNAPSTAPIARTARHAHARCCHLPVVTLTWWLSAFEPISRCPAVDSTPPPSPDVTRFQAGTPSLRGATPCRGCRRCTRSCGWTFVPRVHAMVLTRVAPAGARGGTRRCCDLRTTAPPPHYTPHRCAGAIALLRRTTEGRDSIVCTLVAVSRTLPHRTTWTTLD